MGSDDLVFVSVRRGDRIAKPIRAIPSSSIEYMVKRYGKMMGLEIAPHDLRRTAAKLSRGGGASIEQVQVMLGHASPQTTSQYIGEDLDLDNHAVDYGSFKFPD